MLDKILDDDNYRKDREVKSIERALELSKNEGKMLEQLNIKLKA
jgi:hypothetical protein